MPETEAVGTCWEYFDRMKQNALETETKEDNWWSSRMLERLGDHRRALGLDTMRAATVKQAAQLAIRFSIPLGPPPMD